MRATDPINYYLEYSSTIKFSAISKSISSLEGSATTFPSNFSTSTVNQFGVFPLAFSAKALNLAEDLDFSATAIVSPALTQYEGISTFLPFTVKCPCTTNCLASALEEPNPSL